MPRTSIHPLTFSTFCSMKQPKQPGLCYQNKFFNVLQNHTVWLFKKKIKKLSNNRKHRTAREGQLDKITLFKKKKKFNEALKKLIRHNRSIDLINRARPPKVTFWVRRASVATRCAAATVLHDGWQHAGRCQCVCEYVCSRQMLSHHKINSMF